MTKITYIPGEIANAAIDEHGNRKPVTRTHHIFDDAKGKSQAEVNADIDNTLALHQSEINALNSQNYVTVDSFSSLPATGAVDTVYRVSNWDGTQQDPSVYSEYAWNGENYVHLSTKTQIGEVFDISAYHATGGELAEYADLAAALDSNNGGGVPQSLQHGGMEVRFVRTSDHKYIQYMYMSDDAATVATFTNPANWQVIGEQSPIFHLIGNQNENVESQKLIVKVGNIYRLWIKNPSISCSTVTTGANKLKFAVKAYRANGSGLTPDLVHIYMTDTTTPLDDYYDITIPQNAEYIKIFMKADIGAEQIVWVQDITHDEQIKSELGSNIENNSKEIGLIDLNIGVEFKDLVWEDKLYDSSGVGLNDSTSGKYVHCATFFPVKANTQYKITGILDIIKFVWFYSSKDATGSASLWNKTREYFTVENDGYIRIGIGDGDSFTPSDASASGGILGLNAMKVSDNEHTQQIYNLNNKVSIIDKSFFMLGEMGFPANAPFTYNTNNSRICTKENVYLELKAGDVIGIIGKEGSSTGSRFYYGWIDANGNYKNGGAWIYDRVTIQEDGKYVIYFRDATDVTQDSVDYLFNQLFFDLSSRENDGSLPAYYEPYFSNKVQEIWNEITDGNANDTLVFLIDTHTNNNCLKSGLIINHLYEDLGIKKVFNGGDICDNDGSTWEEIQDSLKKYSKYIASFSPSLYNVRGNHDFNGDVDNVLSGYSSEVVKSWLLNLTDNNIVTNPADPDGTYYYFDNGASRIRYIVIDHYTGSSTGVNNKTDWVQFDWICTQAINTTPNGWSIIFFSHEPLTKRFNVYAATFTNMKGIVDAAKNKTTVTLNNVTYDFSNLGADVIACVCGHCHMDIVTWDNNVLYIRTTSNKLDNWLTPFSEGTIFGILDKPSGTKYEQAMDVMVFKPSDNMICCHRVGFGVNRYIHLTKVSIAVNGTYQLAATKLTPSSWVSSNCDGGTYDKPTNTWSYNASDIVSVNSSGLVTGLQSGDAFVFAKNTNGNMEYFHVVVE